MASYHDNADDNLREEVKKIRDTSDSHGEIRQRMTNELGLPSQSIVIDYVMLDSSRVITVRFRNSKGKSLQV